MLLVVKQKQQKESVLYLCLHSQCNVCVGSSPIKYCRDIEHTHTGVNMDCLQDWEWDWTQHYQFSMGHKNCPPVVHYTLNPSKWMKKRTWHSVVGFRSLLFYFFYWLCLFCRNKKQLTHFLLGYFLRYFGFLGDGERTGCNHLTLGEMGFFLIFLCLDDLHCLLHLRNHMDTIINAGISICNPPCQFYSILLSYQTMNISIWEVPMQRCSTCAVAGTLLVSSLMIWLFSDPEGPLASTFNTNKAQRLKLNMQGIRDCRVWEIDTYWRIRSCDIHKWDFFAGCLLLSDQLSGFR